jgi:hypothetical protein
VRAGSAKPRSRPTGWALAALVALASSVCVALCTAAGASAAAVNPFVEVFGGATTPSFTDPEALAVEQFSGDLLVVDAGAGTVSRFKPNGEAAPFTALGTNVIDGKDGPGAQPCADEPSSCDTTPQSGLSFGAATEVQVAVDESGGVTDGDIYVTQSIEKVVDVFASSGEYLGQLTSYEGETNEVQKFANPAVEYTLTISGMGTTAAIPTKESGATICSQYLQPVIGTGNCSGSGSSLPTSAKTITFIGALADRHVPAIEVRAASDGSLIKNAEITTEGGPGPVDFGESCGVAVGATGKLWVSDYSSERLYAFTPSANPPVTSDNSSVLHTGVSHCPLALGAGPTAGYIFEAAYEGPVYKVAESNGVRQYEVASGANTTVAVDPANGRLYVATGSEAVEYDASGAVSAGATSTLSADSPVEGVAIDGASGEVYVSRAGATHVEVFGAPVSAPTVTTGSASNVTAKTATVSGEINPEGAAVEECYFEYGETSKYGMTEECVEEPSQIGGGTTNVAVHADLSGLAGGVVYHYRLVASNKSAGSAGADESFEFAVPEVKGEYATAVGATGADLGALLSPKGTATEYHFEYGTTASYGSSTATLPARGESAESVQAHIGELLPETTYHYRFVAISGTWTAESGDQTFTTQGPGGPLTLLDGRQWELVSPQLKYGAGIIGLREGGDTVQASESGDAITYVAKNPIEAEPAGNSAPEPSQIMARRAAGGGWINRTLDTANDDVHQLPVGVGLEYKMFSEDLSRSILQPYGTTPLAPSATKERAPYLREEAACDESSSSCFTPFLTRQDTMPGAEWDPNPPDAVPGLILKVNFEDTTPDLSHSVLSSEVKLLEGAGEPSMYGFSKYGLYEWSSEGQLQFVSINAAGEPAPGEFAGPRNGISSDGSRIIWCEERCGRKPLLMRDTATEETLTIASGTGASSEASFQAATADDSKIFYTVEPTYPQKQLWECEVIETGGKLECVATEIASTTVGLTLGINDAGTTVYFVSTAALAGAAEAGANNLYVANLEGGKWEPKFIAKLSSEDFHDWEVLEKMTAKVSPDGRYLAFTSNRSLTGYDNQDAVSGEPDQEVFLYDDQAGRLACASCDPTGARPDGKYLFYDDKTLVNPQNVWRENWVAATVPGWDNINLDETRRQFRDLSNEGRLFFDSSDGLVPQDTNGQQDVYEYEPSGTGSCTRVEGCVNLISSGKSGQESVFLEASASGNDVFFITTEQLTSQDTDTAFDVYDAHVCTSAVPCMQTPVSPPPCSSGESCKPAQTPQPSIFGAAGSATFSGAGNLRPAAPVTRKVKGGTRRQKLRSALETCSRKYARNKRKLRQCRKRVRSRYGKAASSAGREQRRGPTARVRRSRSHGSTDNRGGR